MLEDLRFNENYG